MEMELDAGNDSDDGASDNDTSCFCPLFMTGLPNNFESNRHLAALASLMEEEEEHEHLPPPDTASLVDDDDDDDDYNVDDVVLVADEEAAANDVVQRCTRSNNVADDCLSSPLAAKITVPDRLNEALTTTSASTTIPATTRTATARSVNTRRHSSSLAGETRAGGGKATRGMTMSSSNRQNPLYAPYDTTTPSRHHKHTTARTTAKTATKSSTASMGEAMLFMTMWKLE